MTPPGPLVVIGDSLLDVDLEGTSDRLTPDAAVPVVDVRRQWQRPGGAGLAARLAARTCPDVVLVTAIGEDPAGAVLRRLLVEHVDLRALPLSGTTVCKTRVGNSATAMLRLDTGDGRAAEVGLAAEVAAVLDAAGAVLVSDYGRGVTAVPGLRDLLTVLARRMPVVWDPHPRGAAPVPGCTLVTPNSAEARGFSGADDPVEQGRRLAARWEAQAVAVTVGAAGAVLIGAREGEHRAFKPPSATAGDRLGTPDTCGAGDQFAVAAVGALRAGADVRVAVEEAVAAATTFVWSGGAASVSVEAEPTPAQPDRGAGAVDPFALVDLARRSGRTVVATGGCFDLLHRGHVSLLTQARALGDLLVVCLNSDRSVRGNKGPGRPLVRERDRAAVLTALAAVDGVAIFDEATPAALLNRLRPDIWVKGGDYNEFDLAEAPVVRGYGGRVVFVPIVPGHSTTRLVAAASPQPTRSAHPQPQEIS